MNDGRGPLWLRSSSWRSGGIESVPGRTWDNCQVCMGCEDSGDLPSGRSAEPSPSEFRPWRGSVPPDCDQHLSEQWTPVSVLCRKEELCVTCWDSEERDDRNCLADNPFVTN